MPELRLASDAQGCHLSPADGSWSSRLAKLSWELARGDERKRGEMVLSQAAMSAKLEDLELSLRLEATAELRITGELANPANSAWRLQRLTLHGALDLGAAPQEGYSFLMNGFQSWTASYSLRADKPEIVPIWDGLIEMQDNLRNRPDGRPGHYRADLFGVVGNLDANRYAVIGQTAGFRQMVYVRTAFAGGRAAGPAFELSWDFDGRAMRAGERLPLDPVVLLVDSHANRAEERYFAMLDNPRAKVELPAGWCSWYHYYTKVAAGDITANLDSARQAKVDWNTFVLDDGYMTAVGDWESPNAKFPADVDPMAAAMEKAGFRPGIWLAPFIARGNSKLFKEHPDWFLQNEKGKPVVVGYNPLWGLADWSRFYGIDTTNPEFQAYIRRVIRHFVKESGFRYLKLDFLYAAMLTGRAYDPCYSPAERLSLGLDIIREEAGEETVILGCGCPLSPAIGRVEAMRIGPDVAPFWDAKYRFNLTNDPHALCTKFALRSILVRAGMHRRFWVNDPDCMMLRPTHTKLSAEERRMLVDAVAVTGGMPLLSDDLSLFTPETWQLATQAFEFARLGDQGRAWPLDVMEHDFPRFVYNTAGLLAAFNFENKAEARTLKLSRYLEGERDWTRVTFRDAYSGEALKVTDGVLDFGFLPKHSSRLVRIETN